MGLSRPSVHSETKNICRVLKTSGTLSPSSFALVRSRSYLNCGVEVENELNNCIGLSSGCLSRTVVPRIPNYPFQLTHQNRLRRRRNVKQPNQHPLPTKLA